jgi:UDP-3-O-[3-hydroxymyristoyl] N-acetylglucosamine deacetylase
MMDGLPNTFPLPSELWSMPSRQQTLKAPISCVGIGLHAGAKVRMELQPAPVGTGIVFRRTDLGVDIPARFDHVVDTRLCTVLALPGRPEARVSTVEHLMAALCGASVTNVIVAVDGPELPILDGSSASFLFLIDCAGIVAQDAPSMVIDVLRPVRVEQDDAFVELRPCATGFELSVAIAFDAPVIGRQALSLRFSADSFREDLARARTFTQAREVEHLHAAGLALGGSLDNAVVVDGARVLNPGGLRMADEFVRHKMLDTVGDLALAGAALRGRVVSSRAGHALNNRLLHALFADDRNWMLIEAQPAAPAWAEHPAAA